MNEIEIQKLLVKEAFSKNALPNFNLVDGAAQEGAATVRNYIWQVAGYLQNEKAPRGFGHAQRLQVRSKKSALLILYKLWSGFTKNLRYSLVQKGSSSVKIPKFGTFSRSNDAESDLITFNFSQSQELAVAINSVSEEATTSGEVEIRDPTKQSCATPDWNRIAQVAEVQSGDVAKLLIQTVLATALSQVSAGSSVGLNLKIGRLALSTGTVKFASQKLSNRQTKSQLDIHGSPSPPQRENSIQSVLSQIEQHRMLSNGSLKRRSVSPIQYRNAIEARNSIDQISEASYKNYLTNDQIDQRQVLRHQSNSPVDRKLQSPQPQRIEFGTNIQSTNRATQGEFTKSAYPTMPRKKLRNPNKIRHIFAERRTQSICENRRKGHNVPNVVADEAQLLKARETQFAAQPFTSTNTNFMAKRRASHQPLVATKKVTPKEALIESSYSHSQLQKASPQARQTLEAKNQKAVTMHQFQQMFDDSQSQSRTLQVKDQLPQPKSFNHSLKQESAMTAHSSNLEDALRTELTFERIARQNFNPLKGNSDRIRIKQGGSALSHKAPLSKSNMMAVQPFSRTGYGHAMMNGIIDKHKLNFDYQPGALYGPSDFAVTKLRQQEQTQRAEAKRIHEESNMLYNGHSSYNRTFYSSKRESLERQAANITQLAKMRFNKGVEKAAQVEAQKDEEVAKYKREAQLKADREDHFRKTSLFKCVNQNLQMHRDQQEILVQEQMEIPKEKIDVQTSIQSKRQQDNNERFKQKLRHDKLMSVTQGNFEINSEMARTKLEFKSNQLKQEKEWVGSMVEAQRTEDRFNKQKREVIRGDLRQTYADQANDRKEQNQISIKNF